MAEQRKREADRQEISQLKQKIAESEEARRQLSEKEVELQQKIALLEKASQE